jgi:GT2 family glycosyltransferase
VDDGSTDESKEIALSSGALVLSTEGRKGPAFARNMGANHATADLLLFIDADVCVRPDTVSRVVAAFQADGAMSALFGSYDDHPAEPDFVSQYRNLMHHFIHQRSRREAQTFWSGLGAIRKKVFLEHGGYDTSFSRPAIEDIEFGHRLYRSGCKIILDPSLQVTHLKAWSFAGMLITDVRDRALPWTELMLGDAKMPNDLNVSISQRISVALAFILIGIGLGASLFQARIFVAPILALLFCMLAQYEVELVSDRRLKGATATALLIVALGATSVWSGQLTIFGVSVLTFVLLLLRKHYYAPNNTFRRVLAFISGLVLIAAIVFVAAQPGTHALHILFLATGGLLVLLNARFYALLASKRGRIYAVAAIPFHILFFLYSGLAFTVALVRHVVRSKLPSHKRRCRRGCTRLGAEIE